MFILSNTNASLSTTHTAFFLLLGFVYAIVTLATFAHCIARCENDDRASYAIMILVMPVMGSVLYWKNRPDVFNVAITMAYPSFNGSDSSENDYSSSFDRFSSPPFSAKPVQSPRYSSPAFVSSSGEHPLRTSNSTPPFASLSLG